MGTVVIWEYSDLKRDSRGQPTVLATGVLATDEIAAETGTAVPVKTVTTSGVAADSAALTKHTNFVIMSATAKTYYRIKPKNINGSVTFVADNTRRYINAGSEVVEGVYPGCIISFIE